MTEPTPPAWDSDAYYLGEYPPNTFRFSPALIERSGDMGWIGDWAALERCWSISVDGVVCTYRYGQLVATAIKCGNVIQLIKR